eukprot:2277639-Pleurochrysis_carterae.AAC.1
MINSTCNGRKWNHQYIHTKRKCQQEAVQLDVQMTAGAMGEDEKAHTAREPVTESVGADDLVDRTRHEVRFEVEYSTLHVRTRDWH